MNPIHSQMRIAIADPVSSAAKLAALARRHGIEVVELRTLSDDSPMLARGYDASLFLRVVKHAGDDAATLRALDDCAFILAGADSSVAIVERLNYLRGQNANDPAFLASRGDKLEFASRLAAAGLPVARQAFFTDVHSALGFAAGRYPVVLKPIASGGTQGVFLVGSPDELARKFRELRNGRNLYGRANGGVLVMEYIPVTGAEEVVVDTVSVGGRHVVTDTWRYEKAPLHGTPAMYRVMWSEPMERMEREIGFALAQLDAVGYRDGAAHVEMWRLTDPALRARFGGDFLPVEIGYRLPGVWTDLAAAAAGRDQVALTLQAAVAPRQFLAATASWPRLAATQQHAAVVVLAGERAGRLRRALELAPIRALPSFQFASFKAERAGDFVPRTLDIPTAAGWVGLLHHDRAVLEADVRRVQSLEQELADVA